MKLLMYPKAPRKLALQHAPVAAVIYDKASSAAHIALLCHERPALGNHLGNYRHTSSSMSPYAAVQMQFRNVIALARCGGSTTILCSFPPA